jgi:hypothetical protein
MWDKVTDIAKTAAAMLQSGKVPPNTPSLYREDLGKVNFLASRKFFVVFTSILMLLAFYAASIFVLFLTAPLPTITAAFVTIFVETIKIFAIIISAYLGLQTVIDFKYNSSTNTEYRGENVTVSETVDEKIVTDYANKYQDDPSYPPLEWIFKNE